MSNCEPILTCTQDETVALWCQEHLWHHDLGHFAQAEEALYQTAKHHREVHDARAGRSLARGEASR